MTEQAVPAVLASGWGWRHAGRRAWALRGLDLRIEIGERVLLLGASGAGKSTLLLALAGLLDPAGGGEGAGSLMVHGASPAAGRGSTGIVFQDPDAQVVMARAGDDVAFGLENRCVPAGDILPRVEAALDAVGFRYGPDHSTAELSGGEKQRLALAGVLALEPRLLLLDEPTANLDAAGAALLRASVARLLSGEVTLVLVEHRVEPWLPLVDRVVVLEAGGGVVADGPPASVFGAAGERLAAEGVWVPGIPLPPLPSVPRPRPETLVFADGVGYRYPGARDVALGDVEARLSSGRALAIVGPNGSGKSTLALLLAGLLRPSEGSVLAGEALLPGHAHQPIWRWAAARLARRIGTVFQDPRHQFLTGRVDDELLLGPRLAGVPAAVAHARAGELLERLRLAGLAAANPYTLSGGEQRRLSVATALATAPAALILDEPTFGQDRRTYVELLALLASLRDAGHGVAFASHDEHLVDVLADTTLQLAVGGVA